VKQPNTLKACLLGLCPRCGLGKLFDGYIKVRSACPACGLDYARFDAGDGPAVFGILIVGAIVAALALYVEFTFSPPYWVHFLAALLGSRRAVGTLDRDPQPRFPAAVQIDPAGAAIQAQGGRGAGALMALRFRPYPGLTIVTLIMVALLIGLGVWQIQRLHWKLDLIAMMNRNMHVRPVALDGEGHLYQEVYTNYLHVTAAGHYDNNKETYLFATGPGGAAVYHVLTPFITGNGQVYLVDRGIVPKERLDPATRRAGLIEGQARLTGIWRWPDALGYFTPKPDIANRVWYGRDIAAIAAFDHVTLYEPGIIEADASPNQGGWPQGGQTVIDLPNNHLSYIITWFGLAAGLTGVYFAYHISRGRLGRA
jgi:surfeit locus 1 family protein